MNEPTLPGLQPHASRSSGERRIDRYVAEDLPAIVSEAGMPGLTEVSPYLHVSTYKDWQDVGRWYWGLIKDQLYADESLKRTVARADAERAGSRTQGRAHPRLGGAEHALRRRSSSASTATCRTACR